MNTMQRTNKFLKDLKLFISFFTNLWGALAIVSIFFPIINNIVRIIPLRSIGENGVLDWFSPELFTTIAVLLSISTILALYNYRSSFIKQANLDHLHKMSIKSFVIGIIFLLIYLAFYFFIRSNVPAGAQPGAFDGHRLFLEAVLLCFYSGSFAMITRGFGLLTTGESLSSH